MTLANGLARHLPCTRSDGIADDMAAYDQLPPEVRHALANARIKVSAVGAEKLVERGAPVSEILFRIEAVQRIAMEQEKQA